MTNEMKEKHKKTDRIGFTIASLHLFVLLLLAFDLSTFLT
jgi:hypothetical protein